MKKLIRTSNKDVEEIFLKFDSKNIGFLSNLDFRNALRQMNIGLSMNDIDSIMNTCEIIQPGIINWREFIKKINPK